MVLVRWCSKVYTSDTGGYTVFETVNDGEVLHQRWAPPQSVFYDHTPTEWRQPPGALPVSEAIPRTTGKSPANATD